MGFQLQNMEELAARVFDGAKIAVPSNRTGVPMELARALVRRGVRADVRPSESRARSLVRARAL